MRLKVDLQLDREAVYRQFAQSITSELGPEVFKLMCWGVRPELIGLFDGCRVGNDGFGYGGFSEYNSFNNVVWRNDPDHIELTQPDAYRATTITALTGSVLMLTDPPAGVYLIAFDSRFRQTWRSARSSARSAAIPTCSRAAACLSSNRRSPTSSSRIVDASSARRRGTTSASSSTARARR